MPNFDTYASLFQTGFANSQHMVLAIAFQLGVYGPLIGGLVATWMDGGRDGLLDLWRRITRWNIEGRWYITALTIAFLVGGIPVGIFALSGNFALSTMPLSYVLFVFVIQLLSSGLGEEPGWRGFLLPRLEAKFGSDRYIWLLGLIWAVWHYPFVILRNLPMMQALSLPQIIISLVFALAGMTMGQIGMTHIFVWLYHRTNSVFLMIVFHALNNLLGIWLASFLANPEQAPALGVLSALMPWAIVVILQRRLGKEQFPGALQV